MVVVLLVLKRVNSPQRLVCLGYGMPDQWDLFIPVRSKISVKNNSKQKKKTLTTLFVIQNLSRFRFRYGNQWHLIRRRKGWRNGRMSGINRQLLTIVI